MKILVCIGRDFTSKEQVYETLDQVVFMSSAESDYLPPTVMYRVLPDELHNWAKDWTEDRGYVSKAYHENRDTFEEHASILRDTEMLEADPALIVTFGQEDGIKSFIRRAIKENFIVILGG